MQRVIAKLKRARLFAGLTDAELQSLMPLSGPATGDMLEHISARPGDIVVMLDGGLHMLARAGSSDHLAILSVDGPDAEPGILFTIPPGAVVRLTRSSTYLTIDGDRLDSLIAEGQEQRSLASLDAIVRDRAAALMRSPAFARLTFDQVVRCAEVMAPISVAAGDCIVRQGDAGDCFYVIESGEADVTRSAGGSGSGAEQGRAIARLGAGAAFGEEALLQDAPRNATIRMLQDGRLLRLSKGDFDRLLRPELVSQVTPAEAAALLRFKRARAIDCRTGPEWELARLPHAKSMPLETVREQCGDLDPAAEYVVYCRNGRRAAAAVFLMRQQGIKAHALAGGLAAWPYDIEQARRAG